MSDTQATRLAGALSAQSVLITGADGYVGRLLVRALAHPAAHSDNGEEPFAPRHIVACDLRSVPEERREPGVTYIEQDVRAPELADVIVEHEIDAVVHLAAIVSPGPKTPRELLYSVDVLGTKNVLECCRRAGRVRQLIVTSSGAAYGYHADSPAWLDEADPLRGNPAFAYADHKRLVEEMLARWRVDMPELGQLVFRPGTILGDTTHNQITALFDKRVVIGLRGVDSPFVLIWDEDVVAAIVKGLREGATGIFNLAGDGVLTMREMAKMAGRRYLALPITATRLALAALKRLGLTQYGPEQVAFLRYRPVLSNRRLKDEFGYTPRKTTREVFEHYLAARARRQTAR